MNVKLVSVTQLSDEMKASLPVELHNPEGIMAYAARVSSGWQDNPDYEKLLAYCVKNQHWSVFEMVDMTVEIVTSRAIAQQILRHRSMNFQEFCLSGDSLITTIIPRSGLPSYIPIKKLFERQKWKNYKKIKIRVYDERTKRFTEAKFKEIFYTGKKPCYKLTLDDGKNITCTKEHKFLGRNGWESLDRIANIELYGDKVFFEHNEIAVNGDIAYQNKEVLFAAKKRSMENKTGVHGIAKEFNVSYHTIRKWLKKLGLGFSKKEVHDMFGIWNKNKSGYKNKEWSEESKLKKRASTPKGKDHHSYKGGAQAERKAIANFFNPVRKDIFKKFNYQCQMCYLPFNNFDGKIDLHHIKEVGLYPELAKDINNIIPVHRKCHMEHHGKSYYFREIKKGNRGNLLVPRFQRISHIEYVGELDTYDLEVDHESHNYVANKICVHNSQRYSQVTDFETYEARSQDTKNRQNSIDNMSEVDKEWFKSAQLSVQGAAKDLYQQALDRGIAKEQARFLLPLSTQTKLYMKGSVRSWLHYIALRTGNGTQKEHRDIADSIKEIFSINFPICAKAMGWNNGLSEGSNK